VLVFLSVTTSTAGSLDTVIWNPKKQLQTKTSKAKWQMKRVNAITFLNYFVSGALTMLIPLLLLERNVSLANIGLVISVLPLVFLVARLVFAAIADYVGWSHVFLLINWPTTFAATAIYYFAYSLPGFVVGKVVEGLRESSYWAVSRTAVFHLSPKREGREMTKINALIWLATAVGAMAAGVAIAYMGFSSTLAALMAVSFLVGVPAIMLWRSSRQFSFPKAERFSASLDPRGKSRTFWLVSIALMFNSLATYPLLTLLLPVFMAQELGYSYVIIGVMFMLYNAVSAAATYATLHLPLSFSRAATLTILSVVASALLAGPTLLFPALLMVLAFVRGYGIGFFEHVVFKVAKDSKNLSVDIGFLHAPMRLAEFSSVLVAGFVAQAVGYAPVFVVTGVSFGVFALMSLHILRSR
jgi:MFS family permease